MKTDVSSLIGWMLLRDGHAVPITGLEPDALKSARGGTIEREGISLKHTSGLNAIVHSLGFDGDFGDYRHHHYPRLERLLEEHGLTRRIDAFDVPSNCMSFGTMRFMRRALADRLFLGPAPMPRRVFTGYDHDWEVWEALRYEAHYAHNWMRADDAFASEDIEKLRRWVYRHRLLGTFHAFNFRGDQFLDPGAPEGYALNYYAPTTASHTDHDLERRRIVQVLRALRQVLDQRAEGWFEIIQVTNNLVVLKGRNGGYDLLWRNLRTSPPPVVTSASSPAFGRHAMDLPVRFLGEQEFELWQYYRQGAWEEDERHKAEEHYYREGGLSGPAHPGVEVVHRRYLEATGKYSNRGSLPASAILLDGFRRVRGPSGQPLLVSDLITIAEMREMMTESGYADRRTGDRWEPGNEDDDARPTAATWYDAQAFCAHMERRHGVHVRLPRLDEYRTWFPVPETRDEQMFDEIAPRVVEQLEPWSGVLNEPARCRLAATLPWRTSRDGLRTIDALDAAEWLDAHEIVATPVSTYFMGRDSWGAYKRARVGFRLVIEVAPLDA